MKMVAFILNFKVLDYLLKLFYDRRNLSIFLSIHLYEESRALRIESKKSELNDIKQIIEGCIKGKRQSQEQLYNMFSAKMFAICLRYAKDYDEAKDTLQEGFIKVFAKLSQYKGKGAFEGWLRRVIVNTALEKLRSKVQLDNIEDHPNSGSVLTEDYAISDLTTQDLMKLIQELSPQYKAVFNLYAIEGYSHQEIAKQLNISEGTSKSNLSRARASLQEKVAKYYSTNEKIS